MQVNIVDASIVELAVPFKHFVQLDAPLALVLYDPATQPSHLVVLELY